MVVMSQSTETGLSNPENRMVAIVTGGASGIGWGISQKFAQLGYSVVIADLDEAAAAARIGELSGDSHTAARVNVASEDDVVSLVREVARKYGRIDVLVNNAGIGEQPGSTVEQTVDGFDRVLSIHLRGTFMMSREVARVMLGAGGGAIVNLSSIAGLGGIPGRNAYGAAKAGISSMTRSMAVEWGRSGIRVNAVAPGYVMTEIVRTLVADGRLNTAGIEKRTPMGRFAESSEIADAVAYLASSSATYITGVTLSVDGGWAAHGGPVD